MGNLGDNEAMIPILNDAENRFLKPGGSMLPASVTSYLTPVSSIKAHSQVQNARIKIINNYYKHNFNRYAGSYQNFESTYDCILPKKTELSEPQVIREFEFSGKDSANYSSELIFRIQKPGIFTGFKGYFVAQLSDSVFLDISGDDIEKRETSDCWKHAYLPILNPFEVKCGDVVNITCEKTCIMSDFFPKQSFLWRGNVFRSGRVVHDFYQNTAPCGGF